MEEIILSKILLFKKFRTIIIIRILIQILWIKLNYNNSLIYSIKNNNKTIKVNINKRLYIHNRVSILPITMYKFRTQSQIAVHLIMKILIKIKINFQFIAIIN